MNVTFAIGDIHGCFEEFQQMLEAIDGLAMGGRIIFLGDYVDRGPQSRQVVERIMAGPGKPGWNWIALKGNHEVMMLSALRMHRRVSLWFENGGKETFESYGDEVPADVLDWMEDLPAIVIDAHRIYVHAGVDETIDLDRQPERTLLWSRPSDGQSGDYWGRHLCHGHTPAPENPATTGNRTNIDSGCVFGGPLSAAMFDDDRPGPPIRFVMIPGRGVAEDSPPS